MLKRRGGCGISRVHPCSRIGQSTQRLESPVAVQDSTGTVWIVACYLWEKMAALQTGVFNGQIRCHIHTLFHLYKQASVILNERKDNKRVL